MAPRHLARRHSAERHSAYRRRTERHLAVVTELQMFHSAECRSPKSRGAIKAHGYAFT